MFSWGVTSLEFSFSAGEDRLHDALVHTHQKGYSSLNLFFASLMPQLF